MITTAIVQDLRRKKVDGTYPLKLRVTYEREQKYYGIGISLSKSDFKATQGPRPRGEGKILALRFSEVERDAMKVIDSLPVFTFEGFSRRWKNRGQGDDIFIWYAEKIKKLTKEEKFNTVSVYRNSMISLADVMDRDTIRFKEVTIDFLKTYEDRMIRSGKSETTVSMYIRCLKTIFNDARDLGAIPPDLYPFGRRRYSPPSPRNIKKALTPDEMGRLDAYQPENANETFSKDFFFLSYFLNGANPYDLLSLRWSDLEGDMLQFERKKVKGRRSSSSQPVVVTIREEAMKIIDRQGSGHRYILPHLEGCRTSEERTRKVKSINKTVNDYLKKIALKIDIDTGISMQYARHTWATTMKRAGVPIAFISEGLGHSNIKTTEHYLDTFAEEQRREFVSKLTPWK